MRVLAPRVAKKAGPGQFIILRIDENGERIPLTIAGYDRESGSVTIIFQKVGKTTIHLDEMNAGDSLLDFVGPLGRVSEYGDVRGKRVAVIGGGLGIAIAYPQAVALTELGAEVDMIVGFRNIGLAILMDELQNASKNLIVMTDDGSQRQKGLRHRRLARATRSRGQVRTRGRHRPHADDARRVRNDPPLRHPHRGQHEPHHDRRYRHVRRLPPHRRRRDEVRLRGRPRVRTAIWSISTRPWKRSRMYSAEEKLSKEKPHLPHEGGRRACTIRA